MAVNSTEISSLFTLLIADIKAEYLGMYNNQLVDAETYAKLMAAAVPQTMELAAKLVQQQEQISSDVSYKDKQKELVDSQIIGSNYDNEAKSEAVIKSVYERTYIQPKQLEKITQEIENLVKEIEFKDRQVVEQELTGEKQRESISEEIKTRYVSRVKLDKETAMIGLDNVLKTANTPATAQAVYTPKYN